MQQRVACPLEGPVDPARLSDEELERRFSELQRHVQSVEAERLAVLAELDRRAAHRRDGYLSTKAWLTDRFGVTRAAAKQEVRTAQALSALPEVRGGAGGGERCRPRRCGC